MITIVRTGSRKETASDGSVWLRAPEARKDVYAAFCAGVWVQVAVTVLTACLAGWLTP